MTIRELFDAQKGYIEFEVETISYICYFNTREGMHEGIGECKIKKMKITPILYGDRIAPKILIEAE